MTICGDELQPVAELLAANVADGTELGASICVIADNEVVLDIWDGWTDRERTTPWTQDTLVNVWSTGKLVVNLAALVLIDHGRLDPDRAVADYWPEFANAGKSHVRVRHVLGHTSGVPAWDQPVQLEDLFDWGRATSMLAAQAPWWTPGTASGYHMISQGHLVGEIVSRITGTSIDQAIADLVTGPLQADFWIGAPAHLRNRVSDVVPPAMIDVDADPQDAISTRALTGPFVPAKAANTDAWRDARIPGANAHANARSIARTQAVVPHGGEFDRTRLVSSQTIDQIFDVQAQGEDLVLGMPMVFGLGWALPEPRTVVSVAPGRRCFWGGLGGAFVVNDLDRKLTFAYAMNRMMFEHAPNRRRVRVTGDSRSDAYLTAVLEAL